MMDDKDIGKLFVGGLSWETTQENLQSYFSCFGEVIDCVVLKNNETGRSRGFGFVTFKDPQCVAAVLHAKPHQLNGRTIDAKECLPRHMQKNAKNSAPGKIFLGGLPSTITEDEVRIAMSKFGNVSEVLIMYDTQTNKCRGFGFISFESEDSIQQACAEHFINISGKQVECKRAQSKSNPPQNLDYKYVVPNSNSQYCYEDALPRYQTNYYPTLQSVYQESPDMDLQNFVSTTGNASNFNQRRIQNPSIPSALSYDYSHLSASYSPQLLTQGLSSFPKSSFPGADIYSQDSSYDNSGYGLMTKPPGYHPYRR